MYKKLLNIFKKKKKCNHEFSMEDLQFTGIEPPEEPDRNNEWDEWYKWFSERYDHDSHTKRIMWPCRKCKKVFYGSHGLGITGKHGKIIHV